MSSNIIKPDSSDPAQLQERLVARAYFDELTGLYNRRLFVNILAASLRQPAAHGGIVAVVLLDLDDFGAINDTLGYEAGDQILKEVGKRIRRSVRQSDVVSRFADNEFAVLLTGLRSSNDLLWPVDKLVTALAEPVIVGDDEVRVSASLGSAAFPDDGDDAETLLKNAAAALRMARHQGGRHHQRYHSDIGARLRRRINLELELDRAIEAEELRLHFQPKVRLADEQLVGCEALMRWPHRNGIEISPAEFIPLAEETGLIFRLGTLGFRQAARQIAEWRTKGLQSVPVAVNLSPRQIFDDNLERSILQALQENDVAASEIEVELTESSLFHDEIRARAVLRFLVDQGIRVALDDFGTGYSSLRLLGEFPITTIKIDRSFIRQLGGDTSHDRLVRAIVKLAHELGMSVVAEGVETEEQGRLLLAYGCDFGQGFYYDQALAPAKFATNWLKPRSGTPQQAH